MTRQVQGRRTLMLLAGLCLFPVLAAWAFFHMAPSSIKQQSYGELLPTKTFPAASLADWPRGMWSLVSIEPGRCHRDCLHRRFLLRQIRLAQGEAASRIVPVWLVGQETAAEADSKVIVAPTLTRQLSKNGFFLVDPHGNQVLFYSDDRDPSLVINEINRVLKINNAL